jgi:hypothetical protein
MNLSIQALAATCLCEAHRRSEMIRRHMNKFGATSMDLHIHAANLADI